MKLRYLELGNFKGAKKVAISPNGEDMTIYGDNATGKTTIADAYFWVLFGKTSEGKADFGIKTNRPDGSVISRLDHSVGADFVDESGKVHALKRVYREKWEKKRSAATEEFTGHETDFTINGVPVQKKEYEAHVASLCRPDLFRLLSDPMHFNVNLSWQERRRILLEVCGDITDGDVVAANPATATLMEVKGDRTIEEFGKIEKAKLKEINSEIAQIQPRVDENERILNRELLSSSLVDVAGLRAEIQSAIETKTRILSGGEAAEVKRQIAELDAKIVTAESEYTKRKLSGQHELLTERSKLSDSLNSKENELSKVNRYITETKSRVSGIEESLVELRAKYKEQQGRVFEWHGAETCHACGQSLPEDQIAGSKERALSAFNLARSENLEKIDANGLRMKSEKDTLLEGIALSETKAETLTAEINALTGAIEKVNTEIKSLESVEVDSSADPVLIDLQSQKKALTGKLDDLNTSSADAIDETNKRIEEIQGRLNEAELRNQKINEAKTIQSRIDELDSRHKSLAKEFETIQGHIFLIEDFIRTKVSLLTERINSRFAIAQFKLFDEQINGGLNECCECMVDGTGYPDLNNGMRLNVGLDIIETLSAHYGFAPPIFIDNAESVTQIRRTTGQQIRLVVSESDKTLRFSTAPTTELITNGALF